MKKEQTNNQGGYGLLSLMAMIVGIVIGSGIFVKNAGLTAINGSILNSIIAWIIGAAIVIAIVIAFFEIISITEISGEQATTANWGRHLLGVRFGKFVGYYITLIYFPLIMAGLFSFAGNQFIDTLNISGAIDYSGWNSIQHEGSIIIVTIIVLGVIAVMNTTTKLPGKYLQNVGTAIKTIPLFFMVLLFIVMLGTGDVSFDSSKLDNTEVSAEYQGMGNFTLILMTIPSILFAFDGFLLAGALSKEAKKESTFKSAFLFSMIFIIVIYILFSVAIFGLGDNNTDYGDYGTINNAIYASLSLDVANVVAPIVSGIIFLSIITGASGCYIAATRMLSDLSVHNAVVDKKMHYIENNKYGVSVGSGLTIAGLTLFWFIVATSFDSYLASTLEDGGTLIITGYMTDLIVIGAFLIYAAIIAGAIANRFKPEEKQVKVKKSKIFLPAAIIAATLTFIITGWFAFTTIAPFSLIMNGEWDSSDAKSIYWAKLTFFLIFVLVTTITTVYHIRESERMDENLIEEKAKQTKIYYGELAPVESDTTVISKTNKKSKSSIKNKKKEDSSKKEVKTKNKRKVPSTKEVDL